MNTKTAITLLLLLSCPDVLAKDTNKPPVNTEQNGESLPKVVTIDELLRIVREKSPRYAAALSSIETAQAEVTAADVLPNPTLSYGRYQQTKGKVGTQFDGSSQQQYNVSIPLLVSGQHGARVDYAERKVEVAESSVEMDYNQIIRETWRLFVQLLGGQQRIVLLEKSHQELQQLKYIVTGRADAGAASQYDVLRMQQETQAMATRLESARTDVVGTTGQLGVLLGLPNWKPDVSGALTPLGTPADINKLWALAEENNPAIETAYRESIAADANIEKAKTERWPIPALQVGTAYTDKPYGLTTYVGVAVDVPIFDRNQGGMARAEAGKHTAILNRELLLASTHQELERAVEVLKRRRETLANFETQVLNPLTTIRQMSEDSYRFGKTSLLELLDASRSRTEIKSNYIDLLIGEIEAELDAMMVAGTLADKAKK
ncbi:MAG: TolC family protein [Methylococcales bacterium]|nr:TolC family protein [Methylococcales bacterium]